MANETMVPIIGTLTADPELRFTQGGVPVLSFTIASNPRVFDRQTNQYEDGDPLFMRCTLWREYAENVHASLHKGDRVMAYGKLVQKNFRDREGKDRTSIELDIEEIGPVLRWATARVDKVVRGDRNAPAQQFPPQQQADQWATPDAASYADADEVPF